MKLTEVYKSVKRPGYIKKFNEYNRLYKEYVDSELTKNGLDHPVEKDRLSYADKSGKKVDPLELPIHKNVDKYYRLLMDDLSKELKTVTDESMFEEIKKSFIPMEITAEKTLMFRAIIFAEKTFKDKSN